MWDTEAYQRETDEHGSLVKGSLCPPPGACNLKPSVDRDMTMLLGLSWCCVWPGWCQDRLRGKHRAMGHVRLMTVAVAVWSWPSARIRCLDQVFMVGTKLLGTPAIEWAVLVNWLRQCGLTKGEYWTTLRKASREGSWVILTSVASKRSG